jgi:hypothetical protein
MGKNFLLTGKRRQGAFHVSVLGGDPLNLHVTMFFFAIVRISLTTTFIQEIFILLRKLVYFPKKKMRIERENSVAKLVLNNK